MDEDPIYKKRKDEQAQKLKKQKIEPEKDENPEKE